MERPGSDTATGPDQQDSLVLVFRQAEKPTAQLTGPSVAIREFRVKLDEVLAWFKGFKIDSVDLWVEGVAKSGKVTELFLSLGGTAGLKVTLKPDPSTKPSALAYSTGGSSSLNPILTAYFSPKGGIEQQITALIGTAQKTIEVAAYAFTNQNIASALVAGIKRGVRVTIVMDRSETKGPQATIHDTLASAGAQIRLISPPGGIMHDKFLIVDGTRLEWGSYNYTNRAENVNFENATITSDNQLAGSYHTDFQSIYGQATQEVQGVQRPIRRLFRQIISPFKRRR